MATTLATTGQNAACNAIVDLLDGGTIEFLTSGDVEVATVSLGTPAFGNASSGTATANAITSDTDATGGDMAKYATKTSGAATILSGDVTATGGGGDFEFNTLTVGAGATVSVSFYTVTVPAS